MTVKNIAEKIYDIKRLIMCLEYLTMKLEELEGATKSEKEDIKNDIEEYIVGLDLDNSTLRWIKEINTKWVKGEKLMNGEDNE